MKRETILNIMNFPAYLSFLIFTSFFFFLFFCLIPFLFIKLTLILILFQFYFNGYNNQYDNAPIFTIDDGSQPPVVLAAKERNIIAATFTNFLLKNIGKFLFIFFLLHSLISAANKLLLLMFLKLYLI